MTLYALMEGPSIVGAYRFQLHRGKGVIMDIETTLFTRAAISRFGIAPLTSMYWFSKPRKRPRKIGVPARAGFRGARDRSRQSTPGPRAIASRHRRLGGAQFGVGQGAVELGLGVAQVVGKLGKGESELIELAGENAQPGFGAIALLRDAGRSRHAGH